MNNNVQIKGLSGETLDRILSGGPFYIYKMLSRVGSVTKRPDTKQRSSHYPEQVYDWLCPR